MEKDEMIKQAIELLEENGYRVKFLTLSQRRDTKLCNKYAEKGEDMDCLECSCNCCIMQ